MSLRVEDSRKLLVKLVGTENDLRQETLTRYFRAFLMTKIKTYLAQIMKTQNISIFEVDEHLSELSEALHQKLIPDFLEYGIVLERFFITTIVKPDGDAFYEEFKSLHFRQYADVTDARIRQQVEVIEAETEAKQRVIESQSMATKRQQEGYTYQQERGFDVAEGVANNEAVAQFTNMGVGLGTMAGVGGAVGGVVGGAVNSAMGQMDMNPVDQQDKTQKAATVQTEKASTKPNYCPNCGTPTNGANYCSNCGKEL